MAIGDGRSMDENLYWAPSRCTHRNENFSERNSLVTERRIPFAECASWRRWGIAKKYIIIDQASAMGQSKTALYLFV
jgi:hypothetical protein